MRVFAALDLPEQCKREIRETLAPLREMYPALGWTKAENLHITLAFLGGLDERGFSFLRDASSNVSRRIPPFEFTIGALLFFPSIRNFRILALGLKDGEDTVRLAADLLERELGKITESGLYQFRVRENRKFTAHISAARNRKEACRISRDALPGIHIPCSAGGISLFSSESAGGAPFYRLLHFSSFGIDPLQSKK